MKCFRRFALQILCPAPSLCFHSVSRCDWFVAPSHDFDENKQLDHENTIIFLSLENVFHSFHSSILTNVFHSLEITRLTARDLQAFLVFSQHPAWFIAPVNP